MEQLKSYFNGDLPIRQLSRRTQEIVGRRFTRSDEFHSLAVAAFQSAVDATLTQRTDSKKTERSLLSAMAALKSEFGLTDLYQIESWRPWRE